MFSSLMVCGKGVRTCACESCPTNRCDIFEPQNLVQTFRPIFLLSFFSSLISIVSSFLSCRNYEIYLESCPFREGAGMYVAAPSRAMPYTCTYMGHPLALSIVNLFSLIKPLQNESIKNAIWHIFGYQSSLLALVSLDFPLISP